MTASTLFPTSNLSSITNGSSPNSPSKIILIFPGNGVVASPAIIFPVLTQILCALNVLTGLLVSNISYPRIIKSYRTGGSTSIITL